MKIKKYGFFLVALLLANLAIAACSQSQPEATQPLQTVDTALMENAEPDKNTPMPEYEGTYAVTGTNFDNSPYAGSLTITAAGAGYQLVWQTGNDFQGVGLVDDGLLSAGWGGETCSIVTYQQLPDGSLDGQWVLSGQAGIGTEKAVRSDGNAQTALTGTYTVTGTNPDGSAYDGELDHQGKRRSLRANLGGG
jgi:hypothetical protein